MKTDPRWPRTHTLVIFTILGTMLLITIVLLACILYILVNVDGESPLHSPDILFDLAFCVISSIILMTETRFLIKCKLTPSTVAVVNWFLTCLWIIVTLMTFGRCTGQRAVYCRGYFVGNRAKWMTAMNVFSCFTFSTTIYIAVLSTIIADRTKRRAKSSASPFADDVPLENVADQYNYQKAELADTHMATPEMPAPAQHGLQAYMNAGHGVPVETISINGVLYQAIPPPGFGNVQNGFQGVREVSELQSTTGGLPTELESKSR